MRKRKRIKHFFHFLEYSGLLCVSFLVRGLPEKWFYFFSRFLALFAFSVVRIRRTTTIDNLRHALGDSFTGKELKKIACNSYIHIGMTFLELLRIAGREEVIKKMVDEGNSSVIKKAQAKGRGVVLVTCHYGNWELAGASIATTGIPITAVAKKQANPYVDTLINTYRRDSGMNIVYTGASIKHLIHALKKGEIVALVYDQDAGKSGIFVTFFGRKSSTYRGSAQLVLRYGAALVVLVSVRTSSGHYRNSYREVEVYHNDTVESLTQRFTTIMENAIREHPEQYFWMHRRWKTRPSEESLDIRQNSEGPLSMEFSRVR